MSDEVYHRLAEHLDRLPDGFAPSSTGAEIRLLKVLFTPEEAELGARLTLDREDARAIAERLGMPPAETAQRLEEMARKGLIFAVYPPDGPPLYQAAPWVVGILEYQVSNPNPALRPALAELWSTQIPRPAVESIPQVRTVPVGESVEPHLEVLAYEQIDALIDAHQRYAVAPCICRRGAKACGEGCDAHEESCLMFGEWADYYVRGGRGRSIDRE